MYKICYHVPESHLEVTKQALFDAGAGSVGNYEHCAWQVKGQGQFRPLSGSTPFLGRAGELQLLDEYSVELVCADEHVDDALAALRDAHPYEVPAVHVWRLEEKGYPLVPGTRG